MLLGVRKISAAVIVLAAQISAQNASAQSNEKAALEEIVVNARRVEENLQVVPIAITALPEAQLKQQDIKDFWSLQNYVPALSRSGRPGDSGNFTTLRGITGVVGYFAEAPTDLGGFANTFDISNVQVLKGPQGTLFGTASNAGAVLFEPRKPGDRLSGYVSIVGGNLGRRSIEGALDVPVVEDKVLSRASVLTNHREGYIRDLTTNISLGDQNYWIGRFSLILKPNDDFENYTIFQYYRAYGYPAAPTLGDIANPALGVNQNSAALALLPGGKNAVLAALATQNAIGPYARNGLSAGLNQGGTIWWSREYLVRNTSSWSPSENFTLKNIFGFRNSRSVSVLDNDGTPFAINDGSALNNASRGTPIWSDELQAQGKAFSDKLRFTLGTFHTGGINIPDTAGYNNPPISYAVSFGNLSAQATKTSTLSRAVYGQGTYDFSDFIEGLSFTAGYRYSWDTVRQTNQRLVLPSLVSNRDLAGVGKFSSGSYSFSLQYQFQPDTMFYVTNSKGYSSGGLALAAPPGFQTFQPASLNNVEGGVKSTFDVAGVQLRTNVSGYYGWYDNVQVNVLTPVQVNPAPAPKTLVTITQNAAVGHISGADIDVTAVPTDWLEVAASVSYMDHVYDRWDSLNAQGQPITLTGVPFTYAPRLKYVLRGTVHLPIDESLGALTVSADYSHSGKFYAPAGVDKSLLPTIGGAINPPFHNLDLSANWSDVRGVAGLDALFFVNNVTKNVVGSTGGGGFYTGLGIANYFPAEPRRFGIRLSYSF